MHLSLPVVITPTRAELGARCHRRHVLSDVLSKARYASASLEFGSLIHAGVAQHWLGRDWRKVIQDEWTTRFEQSDVSQKDVSLELAMAMMENYVATAQIAGPFTDQGDWQRVDVEQRFEIPLRDSILSFQCDRMVYNKAENWLVVVDSKTAGRLDARWDRQWETSLQMKLYKGGARTVFATGGRVDVVVEGILKDLPSTLRYYVCPDWSDALIAEAAFNAHMIAEMDAEVLVAGMDVAYNVSRPVQVPDKTLKVNQSKVEEIAVTMTGVNYNDCFSYGIECPFRRLCVADVSERVALLRGEYIDKQGEEY